MKSNYKLYCLSFALAALTVQAEQTDDLNFQHAIDQIIENNHSLAARRATLESEHLNIAAENNLDDPELEFEHQWGAKEVGNKWSISVSQPFEWPGVYRNRSKYIGAESKALNFLYQSELLSLKLDATNALTDYITAKQQLALSKEIKNNIDSIALFISKAFDKGQATVIDLKKSRLEQNEAAVRLETALANFDMSQQELIRLNGGKYLDLENISSYPNIVLQSEDFYAEQYSSADPQLYALSAKTEAAQYALKAQKMKSLPGFSLGYIHNVELGDHFNGIKVGLNLPFFSNRHKTKAVLAGIESAENEALSYSVTVQSKLRSDFARAKRIKLRIDEYNSILGDNDNYLRLLNKSFSAGQISFITYIYEINYYISAKEEYLSLQSEYQTLLNTLNRFN